MVTASKRSNWKSGVYSLGEIGHYSPVDSKTFILTFFIFHRICSGFADIMIERNSFEDSCAEVVKRLKMHTFGAESGMRFIMPFKVMHIACEIVNAECAFY